MATMSDAPGLTNDRGRRAANDPAATLLSAVLSEAAARPAGGPAWLVALRRSAVRHLEATGFPKHNDESWRFTPIRDLLRVPYARSTRNAEPPAQADVLSGFDAPHIVLVNGRPQGGFPNADGLEVRRLSDVFAGAPDRLAPYVGRLIAAHDGFSAVNTALFEDGLLVVARRGVKVGPVHLVVAAAPGSEPTLAVPRILVIAEPMSELRVVESRQTVGTGRHLESAVTEVFVEEGARVEHVRIHRGSQHSSSVATVAVSQGKDSHFASRAFTFGGALARLDLRVSFGGEGAECSLDGLYAAEAGELVDHQTTIDHAVPRCTSRQRYKGIVGAGGVAVFDGTVLVRKGASKTEAHQENRNLCLSPDAVVHTKPHLEIDTDDVKCSHGATVGRLDPAQLFYLRARGMDAELARSVLTYAFAREMVQSVGDDALGSALEGMLATRLPDGATARGLT